jgi:hypothetical protein
LPIRKHLNCHSDICHRGKTLITRYQVSREPHDVTSANDNYRLMHALFHIKTVIIPRDRYRPEGFSPRVDIGREMITVLIGKKACINLFITYFNIELTRKKLTSHTDTKLMDMSDRYRLDICHRGKTLITRYQVSREPHDVTSAQLLIVVWKMSTFSEERFVGVSEAEPSTNIDHSYP